MSDRLAGGSRGMENCKLDLRVWMPFQGPSDLESQSVGQKAWLRNSKA